MNHLVLKRNGKSIGTKITHIAFQTMLQAPNQALNFLYTSAASLPSTSRTISQVPYSLITRMSFFSAKTAVLMAKRTIASANFFIVIEPAYIPFGIGFKNINSVNNYKIGRKITQNNLHDQKI